MTVEIIDSDVHDFEVNYDDLLWIDQETDTRCERLIGLSVFWLAVMASVVIIIAVIITLLVVLLI
jgi:hypothetical protein